MNTTFQPARLTAISANYKSGEVTLTLKVKLNDENLGKAEALRPYLDAEVGGIAVEIKPMQPHLNLSKATLSVKERGATEE